MSKQYLLRISGLAALTLLLFSPVFAQDQEQKESKDTLSGKTDKANNYDEIIIRRKNDKDVKVTVEVKDGQVYVNGKPVAEFDDNNISIRKKKVRTIKGYGPGAMAWDEYGDQLMFDAPPPPGAPTPGFDSLDIAMAPMSPFRNHSGAMSLSVNSNRAFLGVTSRKPEKEGTGAEVTEISKGSAAEKAGLKPGDLITKIDEMKIDEPADLSEAVHKYKPTDKVTVTYQRAGKEEKTTAVLGKPMNVNKVYNYRYTLPRMDYDFKQMMPPGQFPNMTWSDSKPRLGIKAQDMEDGKGVKVLEVGEESAAEKAGIKEGDIITSFDGKEVNSAVALADLAREGREKPSIKIGLTRNGKAKEIEVKIQKKLKTANL